ncbi:hypothetical protein HDU96_008240 [Phlyctochytrium bullatum]|nr:hypothetical protein HDU96_008240 [Phlyctochytrium bullatum]
MSALCTALKDPTLDRWRNATTSSSSSCPATHLTRSGNPELWILHFSQSGFTAPHLLLALVTAGVVLASFARPAPRTRVARWIADRALTESQFLFVRTRVAALGAAAAYAVGGIGVATESKALWFVMAAVADVAGFEMQMALAALAWRLRKGDAEMAVVQRAVEMVLTVGVPALVYLLLAFGHAISFGDATIARAMLYGNLGFWALRAGIAVWCLVRIASTPQIPNLRDSKIDAFNVILSVCIVVTWVWHTTASLSLFCLNVRPFNTPSVRYMEWFSLTLLSLAMLFVAAETAAPPPEVSTVFSVQINADSAPVEPRPSSKLHRKEVVDYESHPNIVEAGREKSPTRFGLPAAKQDSDMTLIEGPGERVDRRGTVVDASPRAPGPPRQPLAIVAAAGVTLALTAVFVADAFVLRTPDTALPLAVSASLATALAVHVASDCWGGDDWTPAKSLRVLPALALASPVVPVVVFSGARTLAANLAWLACGTVAVAWCERADARADAEAFLESGKIGRRILGAVGRRRAARDGPAVKYRPAVKVFFQALCLMMGAVAWAASLMAGYYVPLGVYVCAVGVLLCCGAVRVGVGRVWASKRAAAVFAAVAVGGVVVVMMPAVARYPGRVAGRGAVKSFVLTPPFGSGDFNVTRLAERRVAGFYIAASWNVTTNIQSFLRALSYAVNSNGTIYFEVNDSFKVLSDISPIVCQLPESVPLAFVATTWRSYGLLHSMNLTSPILMHHGSVGSTTPLIAPPQSPLAKYTTVDGVFEADMVVQDAWQVLQPRIVRHAVVGSGTGVEGRSRGVMARAAWFVGAERLWGKKKKKKKKKKKEDKEEEEEEAATNGKMASPLSFYSFVLPGGSVAQGLAAPKEEKPRTSKSVVSSESKRKDEGRRRRPAAAAAPGNARRPRSVITPVDLTANGDLHLNSLIIVIVVTQHRRLLLHLRLLRRTRRMRHEQRLSRCIRSGFTCIRSLLTAVPHRDLVQLRLGRPGCKGFGIVLGNEGPGMFRAFSEYTQLCAAMRMEECSVCARAVDGDAALQAYAAGGSLPRCNVLAAYGLVCKVMPDMSNCALQQKTCSLPTLTASPPLTPLCNPAGSGSSSDTGGFIDSAPVMRMYLHTGISEYVLFRNFVPRTTVEYFGACVLTAVMAVVMMAVESARRRMRAAWEEGRRARVRVEKRRRRMAKREARAAVGPKSDEGTATSSSAASTGGSSTKREEASPAGTCCAAPSQAPASPPPVVVDLRTPPPHPPAPGPSRLPPLVHRLRITLTAFYHSFSLRTESRHAAAAVLRTIEVALAYALMLVVMTFNVGLICAALVGVFVGNWVFGRELAGEEKGGAAEGDCCI